MNQESQKKITLSVPLEHYEARKALSREKCYTLPGYIRQILKLHIQNQTEDDEK